MFDSTRWSGALSLRQVSLGLTLCSLLVITVVVNLPAQAQQFSVIHIFVSSDDLNAGTSLARDNFGNLYGASTVSVMQCTQGSCGAIYKINPAGQLTTLYSFQGPPDGAWPVAVTVVPGVSISDPATLYGTTEFGGTGTYSYCNGAGCGTVFKLTSGGDETVLHSFAGPPADGLNPQAGVTVQPGANPGSGEVLYGTTYYGGPFTKNGLPGEGTVFQIANGHESVLYSFTGGDDGALPFDAPLYRNGVLYGTTVFGGSGNCVTSFGTGCGTVYKLAGGHESALYSFMNQADGGFPAANVIADAAGNLYGSAVLGGDLNCTPGGSRRQGNPPGCGTVFKISPSGEETTLYTFTDGADGAWPSAGLVMDSAGNLYGTATLGGDLNCGQGLGCGTVFKIDTSGHFSVIHTFIGSDGSYPLTLLQDNHGNLYGVTQSGGPINAGVVYKLVP